MTFSYETSHKTPHAEAIDVVDQYQASFVKNGKE
jgi:hypothetical protein